MMVVKYFESWFEKKNVYSLSNEYFKFSLLLLINSELKNSVFGKKVLILLNDSYY